MFEIPCFIFPDSYKRFSVVQLISMQNRNISLYIGINNILINLHRLHALLSVVDP